METTAKIPIVFKPLLESCLGISNSNIIYWVYYSGRGTGKSENISAILVLTMYNNPNTRIACIREIQHSISESVKATLENWIEKFGLIGEFHITGNSIKCNNGSECFFLGLKNSNSPNIKSIAGINITFIEEASQLSEKSWRLLVPSVTRTSNPKIILAFNPDREEDIVYREFVANTPPKASKVFRLKWDDNPFFRNSSLYDIMLDDKERLPEELFAHIWEGELSKNITDSLFKDIDFTPIGLPENGFTEVVIGVDPATTNNEFSNEYGIVVVGKDKKGLCYILEDYTGHYTPREFSSKVVEAYYEYNADLIVVETNQGGDFIASAILDIDCKVRIKEVRAGSSKQSRALPIANMMGIKKLFFTQECPKLRRQMELTTLRGYLGPRGESPDSLDAAIWAVYHLMGIQERDSWNNVFQPSMFDKRIEGNTLDSEEKVYLDSYQGLFGWIKIKALYTGNVHQLEITDAGLDKNLPAIPEHQIVCPDTENTYTIPKRGVYLRENIKLEEQVGGYLGFLRKNPIYIRNEAEILLEALNTYTYDTKRDTDLLVLLLMDIIRNEL